MALDAAKATRWLKREQQALGEYIKKQTDRGFPAQHRKSLDGFAAGNQPAGAAITALQYLANWNGANGARRLLNDDDGGFEELDRACVYSYWAIRLLARGYDANTRPDKQSRGIMSDVATCWMHAEAIGAMDVLEWLSERVRAIDAGDRSIADKNMNELCGLMAHFCNEQGRGDAAIRRLGVTRSLRTNRGWNVARRTLRLHDSCMADARYSCD